jgi:predicted MFS family arabinose efflux permease
LRGHLGTIAWASIIMGCGFGAYYGLTGLYPTLLDAIGHKPGEIAHYVTLFNLGMLGGAVVTGVLAAKKGVARAVAVPALASLPCRRCSASAPFSAAGWRSASPA